MRGYYLIFPNQPLAKVDVEKGLVKTLHACYIEDDSLDNSKNKCSHNCFWKKSEVDKTTILALIVKLLSAAKVEKA